MSTTTGNKEARALIYQLIDRERDAQDRKWKRSGGNWYNEEPVKLAVLTEEVGEVAQTVLQDDSLNMVRELIQVAAVTVSWLESEGVEVLRGIADFDADQYEPDPELVTLRTVYAAASRLRAEIVHDTGGVNWMHSPWEAQKAVDALDEALDGYDLLERKVL